MLAFALQLFEIALDAIPMVRRMRGRGEETLEAKVYVEQRGDKKVRYYAGAAAPLGFILPLSVAFTNQSTEKTRLKAIWLELDRGRRFWGREIIATPALIDRATGDALGELLLGGLEDSQTWEVDAWIPVTPQTMYQLARGGRTRMRLGVDRVGRRPRRLYIDLSDLPWQRLVLPSR